MRINMKDVFKKKNNQKLIRNKQEYEKKKLINKPNRKNLKTKIGGKKPNCDDSLSI